MEKKKKNTVFPDGAQEQDQPQRSAGEIKRAYLFKLVAMIVIIGILLIYTTIAWFTMNKNVETGGMNISNQSNGFELQVGSGTVGFSDLYRYFDGKYGSNSGTITNNSEGGQIIRWRMDTGDDELQPGSQGVLHFTAISTGANINQLNYKLHVSAYDAITHTVSSTDEQGNSVETQVLDNLRPIISSEGYSGTVLDAADYIDHHVMFFTGRHGTSNENYEYYGFIDDKESFELALNNGAGTIYWIWPNTLGQIALEATDTAYIVGTPLLYKPSDAEIATFTEEERQIYNAELAIYQADREKMTRYLKAHVSDIFSGTEQYRTLIDVLYANRLAGNSYRDQFDKLSDGYNTADQTIGRNVEYVVIEMLANTR